MPSQCSAPGCTNNYRHQRQQDGSRVSMHKCPIRNTAKELWNSFVGHELQPNSQLCSAHFLPHMFVPDDSMKNSCRKRPRLKENAYPTIQSEELFGRPAKCRFKKSEHFDNCLLAYPLGTPVRAPSPTRSDTQQPTQSDSLNDTANQTCSNANLDTWKPLAHVLPPVKLSTHTMTLQHAKSNTHSKLSCPSPTQDKSTRVSPDQLDTQPTVHLEKLTKPTPKLDSMTGECSSNKFGRTSVGPTRSSPVELDKPISTHPPNKYSTPPLVNSNRNSVTSKRIPLSTVLEMLANTDSSNVPSSDQQARVHSTSKSDTSTQTNCYPDFHTVALNYLRATLQTTTDTKTETSTETSNASCQVRAQTKNVKVQTQRVLYRSATKCRTSKASSIFESWDDSFVNYVIGMLGEKRSSETEYNEAVSAYGPGLNNLKQYFVTHWIDGTIQKLFEQKENED